MYSNKYLKVKVQGKQLKLLVRYYDAVQDALVREKLGHNDGWDKVQRISDKIEDDIDL